MPTPYYERDGVALYHGDSREVLAELPTDCAHMLLTDPPYGMSVTTPANKGSTVVRGDAGAQAFRLFRGVLGEVDRLLAVNTHQIVFCHWESMPDFYDAVMPWWRPKNALVWDKHNLGPGDCFGDYGHDYELALFCHKGRRRLNGGRDFSVRRVPLVKRSERIHPTQKPVELLGFYIEKSTAPGELVLDPFAGSAATLRAALATRRRAIGVEIDEQHCERAAAALET